MHVSNKTMRQDKNRQWRASSVGLAPAIDLTADRTA